MNYHPDGSNHTYPYIPWHYLRSLNISQLRTRAVIPGYEPQ